MGKKININSKVSETGQKKNYNSNVVSVNTSQNIAQLVVTKLTFNYDGNTLSPIISVRFNFNLKSDLPVNVCFTYWIFA